MEGKKQTNKSCAHSDYVYLKICVQVGCRNKNSDSVMVMGLRVIGIFSLFGSKDYPIPCGLVLGTGTLVLGLTPLRTCDTSGGASPTCRIWWSRQSSGCWRAPRRKLASMCNRCPTPAMSMTCKSPVSRHLYFTGYQLSPSGTWTHHTCMCTHTKRGDRMLWFQCLFYMRVDSS